jgi:hypothetical protein
LCIAWWDYKPEVRGVETITTLLWDVGGVLLFVDDRELNVEIAARLGLRTIHFRCGEQLRAELTELGLSI